ncbi:MAG TPA: LLM class flavin-dependent oxidoreductase [Polyangiales bacterium]
MKPALSVLDLSPIVAGADASQALRNTLDLAQHAERWGYRRFWLAEHHNFPGVASAATAVVIAHVAGGTSRIRVGAGGIMLPNHAPLVIAEQFGTLEALFPGRIDLGLGRAPGSDGLTQHALRRQPNDAERFPEDVEELMAWFRGDASQRVTAVPGAGLNVPIWILGSSLFGAELAATLGLPFAFASHFAPTYLDAALRLYRQTFRPSDQLEQPYVMVGAQLCLADDQAEAEHLLSSVQQAFLALRRGRPSQLPPPAKDFDIAPHERAMLAQLLECALVGNPARVREGLRALIERTGADEIIVSAQLFDHGARLRAFELLADIAHEL